MKHDFPHDQRDNSAVPGSRYWDAQKHMHIIPIHLGHCYVTSHPDEMLVTVLGSCICACIRDYKIGVGGMNHFLLPSQGSQPAHIGTAMRYGAYAMEKLINEIMKAGGERSRLEIKLFGGANVISASQAIGDMNVRFAHEYISREQLIIVNESVGGMHPRRVQYTPSTGKVMVRSLHRSTDNEVVQDELQFSKRIRHQATMAQVDLF